MQKKKKKDPQKEKERRQNPVGHRVWFNVRENFEKNIGLGVIRSGKFKVMCERLGGKEFGEGVVKRVSKTEWVIQVLDPKTKQELDITVSLSKYMIDAKPPGIHWL